MAKQKWGEGSGSRTVSETVYHILHKNIINLNLVPGTVMSEKEISEKMEVSRTPVREAFIKLSNEALVDVVPQKGSFVSKISLARVKEERFLRESLELSVLEDLVKKRDSLDFEAFRESLTEQEAALDEGDTTRFIELDDDFHGILFRQADKGMCYQVVQNFSSHYRRVRYLSISVTGVTVSNLNHHKELVSLVEEGDAPGAVRTMKDHLRRLNIEKDFVYDKFREYFADDSAGTGPLDLIDEKAFFTSMKK